MLDAVYTDNYPTPHIIFNEYKQKKNRINSPNLNVSRLVS